MKKNYLKKLRRLHKMSDYVNAKNPIMSVEDIMNELGQTKADLEKVKSLVRTLYKNDAGKPFEMTDSQACIFDAIYRRLHPKILTLCYTQFGKSEVVSMAVLTRITTFAERWVIIGGTKEKAEIIMQKLIRHIFDNEYTKGKLNLSNSDSVERLRHARSRERITFRVSENDEARVGEVFVLSGDSSKKGKDSGDTLVGHGAPNIIVDDTPLMNDTVNAKLMRMLGGHKDHFLMKIGNALGRNHFWRAYKGDRYKKIVVDYKNGVQEGRQSLEYFEDMYHEMNDKILFDSFYGCIFPPADAPLDGMWIPILTEGDIRRAQDWEKRPKHVGEVKFGVDVADSGVDHDVIIARSNNFAEIVHDTENSDQMTLAGLIPTKKDEFENLGYKTGRIYIDGVGVGAGVCSKLRELGVRHRKVSFGERSINDLYVNKKAEIFWKLKKWIDQGGKLSKDKKWEQLTNVHYSTDRGQIRIIPKRTMRTMGIKSPDIADGLALTFYDRDSYVTTDEDKKEEFFKKKMKEKKKKKYDNYNLRMS
ncbi:MAG: hypothetical protein ACOC5D_02780 [Thermoplasmatota archaeon]